MKRLLCLLLLLISWPCWSQVSVLPTQSTDTSTTSTTGSFDHTIDAGTQLVIVYASGFTGNTGAGMLNQLSFDGAGLDFQSITCTEWFGSCTTALYYINTSDPDWPNEGVKTISWEISNVNEGIILHAMNYQSVNVDTPTSSIGNFNGFTGSACENMASMGSVSPDSLSVIHLNEFNASAAPDPAPSGSGQTNRQQVDAVDGVTMGIGDKPEEDRMQAAFATPDNASCGQAEIIYAEFVGPPTGPSIPLLRRRGR